MKQFYLTLPSNSSMEFCPKNTTAKFTTYLRRRITLHGSWEVGLVEIHFPFTYYNVRRGENYIKVFAKDGTKTVLQVPPNYYRTKEAFFAAINKSLQGSDPMKKDRIVGVIVDNAAGVTQFIGNELNEIDKVKMSSTLVSQLGFELGANLLTSGQSNHAVDLNRGFPNVLYCYCDVIEEQLVGDTTAPLLRIVNTQTSQCKYGRECTQIFDTPIYVPVQKREFNTIEIDLRDGTGNAIPFTHGTSSVLLDFRQVKDN